jgi:hypothetical protein
MLAKYVCVRVVQMKGADLSLFQFDGDQTWCAFFLNADRTIYGRYGTRSTDRATADHDVSEEGFAAALEAALAIHAGYPANKASLAGKTGPAPKSKRPEDMTSLQGGRHQQPLPRGCIHCHEVQQATREETRPAAAVPDEWLWVYPMPDVVGLSMDVKARATVSAVAKGSAAEAAGFKAKDRIATMDGQPIVSIADVQWVLQRAKAPSDVAVEVEREGGKASLVLHLADGFRRAGDLSWRESSWALRPGMRVDGLPEAERKKATGGKECVGLRVRFAGNNGAAAKAGLKAGDVILSVDGLTAPMTETEFLAYLYQRKTKGADVALQIAHGSKRDKVTLPAP